MVFKQMCVIEVSSGIVSAVQDLHGIFKFLDQSL